jgi:hypothetical protein
LLLIFDCSGENDFKPGGSWSSKRKLYPPLLPVWRRAGIFRWGWVSLPGSMGWDFSTAVDVDL